MALSEEQLRKLREKAAKNEQEHYEKESDVQSEEYDDPPMDSYEGDVRYEDEDRKYRDRRDSEYIIVCGHHWASYIPVVIIAIIFIRLIRTSLSSGNTSAAIMLLIIGVIVCAVKIAKNLLDYIALSPTHITGRRGLIRSFKLVSPISRVQDVSIENGLFGKIFGYHTITVTTAGTGGKEYCYKTMCGANEFQEAFLNVAD